MSASTANPELRPSEKRALLAKLLAKRADQPQMSPVSYAQSRLWFLDQFQPGQPVYNIPIPIPLNGFLDIEALRRSVNEIIRRHEALRTTIQVVNNKPVQVIAPALEIAIPLVSMSSSEPAEIEASRLAMQEGRRPFDLAQGPLIRATILKLAPHRHILLIVMHHIVSDGSSIGVFLRELSALYSAFSVNQPSPLPELPIQYADYAKWQAEWISGSVLEEHLAYWRAKLDGLNSNLELPFDRARPRVQTHQGATETFTIEAVLLAQLNALARHEGCTFFMVMLAAFEALVYRYSGETNFAVGSPIANRTRPETEALIGFFVNTLVLRAELSPEMTFRELLARVRQNTLEAYEHQDLPFEKLIEEMKPIRDTAQNPLFQVMLTVQHAGESAGDVPGWLISNGTAKFDLTVVIIEAADRAHAFFEYSIDLFDQETMLVLCRRFRALLASAVREPDAALRALSVGAQSEPAADISPAEEGRSVPEMIASHAQERPQAIALASGRNQMTYAELDRTVNRYARILAAQGIQAGKRVAVCMERSIEQVVAILGAMRLGAICAVIDPDEPPQRLAQILADTRADLVIRQMTLPGEREESTLPSLPQPGACMVYRSSVQGTSAAVELSQRMLSRARLVSELEIQPSDRVAWHSGFSRDFALNELFGSLYSGASIAALPNLSTPLQFARALRDHGITVLFVSCVLLKRLSQEFPWALRQARLVLVESESLGRLQELSGALSPVLLKNTFVVSGWTQAGGVSAYYRLEELATQAPALPLGWPLAGMHLDLLDDTGNPAPEGMVGEVVVDGQRTGDFATRRKNGYMEFRNGQSGHAQISGVRVETAEVEQALLRHERIAGAVVLCYRVPEPGLAAFVTWRGDAASAEELQDFLRKWLLPEMVPKIFHSLKEFPLAKTGEIDRAALRARLSSARSGAIAAAYVSPRNAVEEQLTQIWVQALGDDRIGVHDNFFARGGHSLLATQLMARISDHFKVDLPLRRLFEKPTVAELAEELGLRDRVQEAPAGPAIPRLSRDEPIPLSFAQQRLWFLSQYEPSSPFYNMPTASRLRGFLDVEVLRGSLNALVSRHESLRTIFTSTAGVPAQIIHPSLSIEMPVYDLRDVPEASREIRAQELAQEEARLPFDLAQGPLIRAQLLRLAMDDHILLLTIHHIVSDGWSMDVLFRELGAFYGALSAGQDPALPELALQYADFACWQRRMLTGAVLESQLGYWKQKLKDAPPLLELPTDRPRPRIQVFRGGMHTFSLPLALLERLRILYADEQVTLFMVLLAAFKSLLYRYTGQTDLVLGTPVANRVRPELENLIGFFANTLVLRSTVSGKMSFRELLREIRKIASEAYAHQDLPFEKLVEELVPERNLGYNPVFQVMFTLQNIGKVPLPGGAAEGINPALGTGVAKFDLTAFLVETANGLEAAFEYNASLFDRETVERLGQHYSLLLSAAADDPDRSIETLPMLTEAEVLEPEAWNTNASPFPDCLVQQLFEAQVERAPEAVAVTAADGSSHLTYRELNEIANGWAHRLRSLGTGVDTCVGIYLSRSISMIAAVLAVLKAGHAYVPLDPNYPQARLAFMAEDAHLAVILSERALANGIDWPAVCVWLMDGDDAPRPRPDNVSLQPGNDRLAYVIYTSGSTGRPKGVAMTHRPLVNLLEWQNARSNLPANAATLQFTSLSFDVSFQEIFATLSSGGRLCLLQDDQRIDPDEMWSAIERGSIHRIFMPFVALQQLAEAATRRGSIASSLREVITAGEQLKITPAIARFAERASFTLYNQYGPTETHVVTEFRLEGPPSEWPSLPPIGKPIANASIHILDGGGQLVPAGVPGEIYVSGVPLAREYLHQPELTAGRFVMGMASSPDDRLYRTGDRGRYLKGGVIEFLGRADTQVKVRGFRVELEEIEGALQRHPAVQAAAVTSELDATGASRLIAHVQLRCGQQADNNQLRRYLAACLPDHMVPSAFCQMEALPLTPSGKLDRKALPDFSKAAITRGTAFTAPRTPVEEMLAGIWRELLRLERIAIDDNFFELGGHSLLAMRVMSRISDELDINLPVRQLFESPTIAGLATAIVHGAVEQDEELEKLLSEIEDYREQ